MSHMLSSMVSLLKVIEEITEVISLHHSFDDTAIREQKVSFSRVSVYGQNMVVERAIHTVVNPARTIVLYQALLWLEQFDMRV